MLHCAAIVGLCAVFGVVPGMANDACGASAFPRADSGGLVTPGRVLVRVRRETGLAEHSGRVVTLAAPGFAGALDAELARLGARGVEPLFRGAAEDELARACRLDRYFVVTIDPGIDPREACEAMVSHVGPLEGVWPLAVGEMHAASPDDGGAWGLPGNDLGVVPDDPYFGEQYSLRNVGQSVLGSAGDAGADIGVLQAWIFERGAADVRVAVLDTGLEAAHPDFEGAVRTGYSVVGAPDSWSTPTDRHGTHVAGIIGARADDGVGIAGVAPGVEIVPVRVFQLAGFGFEQQFLEGVYWAADEGVDVISMSLGFPFATQAMRDAMLYARARGALLVASTGNTPGAAIGHPAVYPEVLAVSATNHLDELWITSTIGPQTELSAPGFQILSAWSPDARAGDAYIRQSGTSMAVPHVSGVAALVRSVAPDISVDDLTYVLISTAVDLGEPGRDPAFGFGRVDAGRAVLGALEVVGGACRADLNGDGVVNNTDIQLFVNAFLSDDLAADLASPFGVLNVADISAFTTLVTGGCGAGRPAGVEQ